MFSSAYPFLPIGIVKTVKIAGSAPARVLYTEGSSAFPRLVHHDFTGN